MHERRRFKRWQIHWQAQVTLQEPVTYSDCIVKDICFKGLQIVLGLKLPKDTFLKLSVVLSSEFVLNAEAWVAWHKIVEGRNIYGLYFTRIHDSDKEKIYQFIRRSFPDLICAQWWRETPKKEGGETMEDRRIFARFSAAIPLKFMELDSGQEGQAKTCDICAQGFGVITRQQLTPQSPIEMRLEVPDTGKPLATRGKVLWSRPAGSEGYRAGIKLDRVDFMGLSRVLRTVGLRNAPLA